jgi:uncharacterized protein (TIGR04255 family)
VTNWYDIDGLPSFDNPPVVETAMAIEFPPVEGMDLYRLTRLQSVWEERYPLIESRPGTPPTATPGPFPGVVVNMGAPITRMWASGGENGLLVQSQTDRLILNWRKEASASPYPGYFSTLRPEFSGLWAGLLAFLQSSGLPAPQPTVAEYDYVNWVPLEVSDSLADVVSLVRSPEKELPGEDQYGRFEFVRQVTASDEHPFTAQISTTGQPEQRPDGSRQLAFTVVCRAVIGASGDDPLAGLDAAHALAAHTFSRIVTEDKLDQWRRS